MKYIITARLDTVNSKKQQQTFTLQTPQPRELHSCTRGALNGVSGSRY